ncbi:MAG: deoxyribodipyrimidine photo-lyase [Candidatus Ratteibacteria bacterium]
MHKRSIYWFKRDLRIEDNRPFIEACKKSKEIIPIFIFIPELLQRFKSYDSRTGFIIESITYLTEQLKKLNSNIFCYYDSPENVFNRLINKYGPQAIYTNRAFSWIGEEIEKKVFQLCKSKGIKFYSITDFS